MLQFLTVFFTSTDLPLRQIVGEECVVFMLNWRENEYLTLQVPQSLVNNNPYVKVSAHSPHTLLLIRHSDVTFDI